MAKYTFNFTDKSVLTNFSLFCKSGLLFTVLLLFSSSVCSTGMLSINFLCSPSALLQLVQLFFSAFSLSVILLYFFSFCHSALMFNLLLRILSSIFLTVSFFFTYSTTNQTQSVTSSFIHTGTTFQLPNSLEKLTTTIPAN
jgi:hypothetical protein